MSRSLVSMLFFFDQIEDALNGKILDDVLQPGIDLLAELTVFKGFQCMASSIVYRQVPLLGSSFLGMKNQKGHDHEAVQTV